MHFKSCNLRKKKMRNSKFSFFLTALISLFPFLEFLFCVKSACKLPQIIAHFESNSFVICVKLQRFMNEIAHKELWKSKITPVFSSVFLCLVVFWNVKNHITIFTEIKPFYRHDTLKHIHITEDIKIRWCRYPTSLSHFEMLKNRVKSSLSSCM